MADLTKPEVSVKFTIPQLASVLTALDLSIDTSRQLDNIIAFSEAKAIILSQIEVA